MWRDVASDMQVAYCPYTDSGATGKQGHMFAFPRVKRDLLAAEAHRMHIARQAVLSATLPDAQAPRQVGGLGARKKAVVVRKSDHSQMPLMARALCEGVS